MLRRSGAIVISSSRGTELSFEDESIQNGYFTEEILRALTSDVADRNNDGLVSPAELSARVRTAVASATHGAQNPTVDHDNTTVDFGLPVVRAAAPIATRELGSLPARTSRQRGLELSQAPAAPCVPATPAPHACGCRAPGNDVSTSGWWALLAAFAAWSRRRSALKARDAFRAA